MKKHLIFLKGYYKEAVLAPLFKMLEALFELMVPLAVAQIIDVGMAQNDSKTIFWMCKNVENSVDNVKNLPAKALL